MAVFSFESGSISLVYQIGVDNFNEPVFKATTYRNLKNNATADQVSAVSAAIGNLSADPLFEVIKTQKDLVVGN